ncbi:MAG: nucleoside triphosphate pyrophosphohydrolase family protein [Bacteroidota bacterium]|nr:nucleoside triphosphate pyrophosphohydrolase family protein [Bacteroidota bacterium]MEC7549100.1 nucleoside triphosphate pyrophosphohydrolase family protein [Bacteroidota bacterium]MEC7829809.1 nucleoside triphosphate pyrophosphohydrolase family protein [Bacteroidota bacterium]MEC8363790.1 nucleoside triphosphate pyrophosphohydrolase family protein [Bacteroidota bacterium]MEC9160515.1 nucleoside triphosphate pyrophosphohydrolase family protein [Bacteroidota bacterium]|tara:strand:- start:16674 stop:17057 length:384 start_codon:yes stop_codon:yes gene_type:complete
MQNQLKSVKKFHQAFGVKISNKPTLELSKDILKLRHSLMQEENNEYLKAVEEKNLIEVADALGDMLYILCGTILTHGFQNLIEDIFDEIQSSNMSKLGDDGKPIYRNDGKVLKGPNYKKPNIKKIIN